MRQWFLFERIQVDFEMNKIWSKLCISRLFMFCLEGTVLWLCSGETRYREEYSRFP
uniref:Uncharacterized protein n=1 Tax=Arundo donax TaxID=35708 RepID=A0A0A9H9H4_ARUDO